MEKSKSTYSIVAFKFGIVNLFIPLVIIFNEIDPGFAYFAIYPLCVFWGCLIFGIAYTILCLRERTSWRKYVGIILNFGILLFVIFSAIFE